MLNLTQDQTLQSGDDVGNTISCYDCGASFINGTNDDGYVACPDCGGRHAYIVNIDDTL